MSEVNCPENRGANMATMKQICLSSYDFVQRSIESKTKLTNIHMASKVRLSIGGTWSADDKLLVLGLPLALALAFDSLNQFKGGTVRFWLV